MTPQAQDAVKIHQDRILILSTLEAFMFECILNEFEALVCNSRVVESNLYTREELRRPGHPTPDYRIRISCAPLRDNFEDLGG